MAKSDTIIRSKKQLVIILAIVLVVLLGGGAAAYFGYVAPAIETANTKAKAEAEAKALADAAKANGTTASGKGVDSALTPARKESVKKAQDQINSLVQAGGTKSIDEANTVAEEQVQAANESGDDAYIVSAGLARAALLVDTDRAQEALDDILFPLDTKYGTNETYRYDIYAGISYAYRGLDNQDKSEEYLKKIPGGGWE